MRLDLYLQQTKNISRTKAQEIIKQNMVFVDKKNISKPSFEVNENNLVEICGELCQYVSRAGLKLEGACKQFDISLKDKIVLDIGSSTGGFSDYCLQNGAKKVYCVDVGKNQLAEKIRNNPNVVVMEETDIRNLTKKQVSDINFVVCDVSFISLTKISFKIAELLNSLDMGIILVKPQFECGKNIAKKCKGVIKDDKIHKQVIDAVSSDFISKEINVLKIAPSCIKGGDGNTEFVFLVQKK